MRTLVLGVSLGFVLIGSTAQAAFIDPVSVGLHVILRETDSSGAALARPIGGGPFRVDLLPYDPPQGPGPIGAIGDFLSFCLELNEALIFNTQLNINQISNAAYGGGLAGGSRRPDPLAQVFRDAVGQPGSSRPSCT